MRSILLFTCLVLSINLSSQSCGFDYWTQEEIDSFPSNYPGCTEILGLQVDYDVTNLDSLYNVNKISGVVYFNTSNSIDITGIQNIDTILGSLYMDGVTLIGNFNNVEYIGGSVDLHDVPNLDDQINFTNLQYIGGNLNLNYYSNMSGLFTIFNTLDSVNGYINLYLDDYSLEGFNQLQKAERLYLDFNNGTMQNAFNNLDSISKISIYGGNSTLITNSFSSLTTVKEDLFLNYVKFVNFPFTSLISVNDLRLNTVKDFQSLTDLNPNLDITNKLQISYCNSLTDLDGLSPNHIANLNILSITSNSNLSICDYDHICDLLNGPISFSVNGNGNGCKDIEQLTNRCTESGTPPINDQCANAIEIFYSEPLDCSSGDVYTTNSARMHKETYCVTVFGEEVFFEFTPTASKAYSIMLTEFDKAMGMELYQGSCTDNELIQCGYSEISRYLEADSTYQISVFCDIPTEFTDFKICVGETTLEGDIDGFGVNVASPLQDLHIDGAILIGNTSLDYAGSIRFNGTHFQGFNGFEWRSLDSSSGIIGFQMPGSSQDTPSAKTSPDAISELEKMKEENEKLKARLKKVEEKLEELMKKLGGN